MTPPGYFSSGFSFARSLRIVVAAMPPSPVCVADLVESDRLVVDDVFTE